MSDIAHFVAAVLRDKAVAEQLAEIEFLHAKMSRSRRVQLTGPGGHIVYAEGQLEDGMLEYVGINKDKRWNVSLKQCRSKCPLSDLRSMEIRLGHLRLATVGGSGRGIDDGMDDNLDRPILLFRQRLPKDMMSILLPGIKLEASIGISLVGGSVVGQTQDYWDRVVAREGPVLHLGSMIDNYDEEGSKQLYVEFGHLSFEKDDISDFLDAIPDSQLGRTGTSGICGGGTNARESPSHKLRLRVALIMNFERKVLASRVATLKQSEIFSILAFHKIEDVVDVRFDVDQVIFELVRLQRQLDDQGRGDEFIEVGKELEIFARD